MLKRLFNRLTVALAPPVAAVIIRLLRRSMRIELAGIEYPQACWDQGQPLIFACWHDQLLMMACSGYRGPGARILISASRDGELIARAMACFGYGAVRGSSSRGGRSAFRQLVELSQEPLDLAFTPDGPRGPRHEVKEGVARLACLTGRPVIPLAFAASRGHRFASWDRFLLPYPFSRGVYLYGPPVIAQPGESAEAFRVRLQQAMEANDRQAGNLLERHGVSAV